MLKSIYNYKIEDLENILTKNNLPKYRAKQVFDFLYNKRVSSFSEMKNIGSDMLGFLESNFSLDQFEVIKKETSSDSTTKFLFKLSDNNLIETVLMPHDYGNSVCISSEVGCLIGCKFCASGLKGRVRSLETGEMVMQLLMVSKLLNIDISSVVIMGIGEPFLNYDNVINFIKILNDPKAFNMGARRITVSTSGIVDKIIEFSKVGIQANLAISFHSPFDEIRSSLMPINKKYNINSLINAIKEYLNNAKRRVAIEYLLIKDVNDREQDAKRLTELFKGLNVYFNLIPYNNVVDNPYERSTKESMLNFLDILKKAGFDATLRKEYGHDINAACGQLRQGMLK